MNENMILSRQHVPQSFGEQFTHSQVASGGIGDQQVLALGLDGRIRMADVSPGDPLGDRLIMDGELAAGELPAEAAKEFGGGFQEAIQPTSQGHADVGVGQGLKAVKILQRDQKELVEPLVQC